jgi:molybdate transport system ATP-binding protein
MSGLRVEARDTLREIELDVELSAESSETVALVGPSGAGKTTVLRVIAGLHRPAEGCVTVCGETWLDTRRRRDLSPDRRSCGYLFQDYALFPHLSAWRNVAFGLEGQGRSRRERALAELDRFGIESLADVRPAELSGGERQRVALARSLARDPAVLLLDEPLAALDSGTRRRAEAELASTIAGSGIPVVFVTHSFSEAAALADRLCVIDDGKVAQQGTPAEVSRHPASGFVAELTGAMVMTGNATPSGPDTADVVLDDGGFEVRGTGAASGAVDVAVLPWDVSIAPAGGAGAEGSNRIETAVLSVTEAGNRARVALVAPRGLVAEVPVPDAVALGLRAGSGVEVVWAPEGTRVFSR